MVLDLQVLPERTGFNEKPKGCDRFFRSGRSGEGAEKLTLAQRQRLSKGLSNVMKRFDYELIMEDDRDSSN